MTASPLIIERSLTFLFAQSVSVTTGRPAVMEVALIPLGDVSGPDATYVGGLKTATV